MAELEGTLPSSLAERLDRLAPDQRDAATAPPGPVLCVAPAGSGRTTTLVARVAWLVGAAGADPAAIAAITFNTRAAEELRARLDPALEQLGIAAGSVRVRTFHALGLEVLRDAGACPELRARDPVLRHACPDLDAAARRRLDGAFSRLKLDLRVAAADVARDPAPGPVARAFLAYEATLAASGGVDFDDLVALALRRLEADTTLLERWRSRCAHLLVDEVQDVDASQLRLALLLSAPDNRIFLVGDDDQSIYGWRLADVRRVLGLAAALPGLRRVDLEVNYRCPASVVAAAVRLVEHNAERFAKRVRPRPGAAGRLVLAPARTARDPVAEMAVAARVLDGWPTDGGTRAVLARTRRELHPAAALALERGIPFRADGVGLLLEDPRLDGILAQAAALPAPILHLLRLGRVAVALAREERGPAGSAAIPGPTGGAAIGASAYAQEATRRPPTPRPPARGSTAPPPDAADLDDLGDDDPPLADLLAAVLAWATAKPTLEALTAAVHHARARLAALREEEPQLTLATAHATKGLEFDHVLVVGMSEGRFPSLRSLADAADPARALEEERRLAYVAWTRARRTLALAYEPDAPSRFMIEAFGPEVIARDAP
jgi:DNA helicase-2/ATP-dependent DNA helicase PcrA